MPMRLLIVDDHERFRHFIADVLAGDGFVVAGEAADGESAVSAAARLQPDAVLLDIQLPDIDGFEVARRLAAQASPPRVVLTSSRSAADFGELLPAIDTCGFLPKRDISGEALTAVLAGEPCG